MQKKTSVRLQAIMEGEYAIDEEMSKQHESSDIPL